MFTQQHPLDQFAHGDGVTKASVPVNVGEDSIFPRQHPKIRQKIRAWNTMFISG
jgi:hypothetical protein